MISWKDIFYFLIIFVLAGLYINYIWNHTINIYKYEGKVAYEPSMPIKIFCSIAKISDNLPIVDTVLLTIYSFYDGYEDLILSMKNISPNLYYGIKASRYYYLASCSESFAKEFLPKAIKLIKYKKPPIFIEYPDPAILKDKIQTGVTVSFDNNILLDAGIYSVCIHVRNYKVVDVRFNESCAGYMFYLNPLIIDKNKLILATIGIVAPYESTTYENIKIELFRKIIT